MVQLLQLHREEAAIQKFNGILLLISSRFWIKDLVRTGSGFEADKIKR
jgi:hypothetical protein